MSTPYASGQTEKHLPSDSVSKQSPPAPPAGPTPETGTTTKNTETSGYHHFLPTRIGIHLLIRGLYGTSMVPSRQQTNTNLPVLIRLGLTLHGLVALSNGP